jgi:hypothetical protein
LSICKDSVDHNPGETFTTGRAQWSTDNIYLLQLRIDSKIKEEDVDEERCGFEISKKNYR